MNLSRILFLALFAASLLFTAACEREGPIERAGEAVDETAEEAGDKLEDVTDR